MGEGATAALPVVPLGGAPVRSRAIFLKHPVLQDSILVLQGEINQASFGWGHVDSLWVISMIVD